MASARNSALLVGGGPGGAPGGAGLLRRPERRHLARGRLEQDRRTRGLPPLPSLAELAGPRPEDRLLREVPDLLAAQNAVLSRIAALLKRGGPAA